MEKRKTLTKDLAPFVESIINKKNPDHGARRFKYQAQKHGVGKYTHLVGSGKSLDIILEAKFDAWSINSYLSPDSFAGKMAILRRFEDLGLEPYGNDSEVFKLVLEELAAAGTLENAPGVIKKVIAWEDEVAESLDKKKKIELRKLEQKNPVGHAIRKAKPFIIE